MNNLHRELAPISAAAWTQLEEEATRTLKRSLAGRRVVDLQGPGGPTLAAVGTGHTLDIAAVGRPTVEPENAGDCAHDVFPAARSPYLATGT